MWPHSFIFIQGICSSNLEGPQSPIGVAFEETRGEGLERSAGGYPEGTAARTDQKRGDLCSFLIASFYSLPNIFIIRHLSFLWIADGLLAVGSADLEAWRQDKSFGCLRPSSNVELHMRQT